MFKGFYMATSGMLTQSRILNTISNNMANASTPGYKKDTMATTTFQEELVYRTGNKDKSIYTPLGTSSAKIRTVDELVTNYGEGTMEFTERDLDVAVTGEGFFEIQANNGNTYYTRNGSFNLDEEGYLTLQHIGRVSGRNGQPIFLGTDDINIDQTGVIRARNDGRILGTLRIVEFQNLTQLQKTDEGMFENTGGAGQDTTGPIMQGALERSNVTAMDEMVAMIASQRAFQSASQIAKMYDQLMDRAGNLAQL